MMKPNMPIVFGVYENGLTRNYNQEWEVRVGMYAIIYYAETLLTLEQARVKIAEITTAMGYITSITNMNLMVPRKTWEDDF